MSESALKFGPEWLRNLSQGTNVSSPPPSPGLGLHTPKFKLAEFRYGREEMLAIFPKDIKMPPDLKQFSGMHKEQYQLPVTLVALTEEEQKIWTRSVNSDAVLRLMGKGTSGTPAGPPVSRGGRGGGSVDRGRGRGRATYFQRGPSLEDGGENAPPGIFTRQRSYERPNPLSERGAGWEERERRYEKGFAGREEEPGASGRKENSRGNLDWRSNNQRDRDGDDEGGWRVSGLRSEKWGRTGWRSERGEHDDPSSEWPSNGKVAPRKSNTSRTWNDDHPGGDILPEWSTEDNRVADSVGTFDATGAFMETKDDDRKVKLKEGTNSVVTTQDASHLDVRKSHSTSPSPGSPKEVEVPQQPSPEPKNTSSPPQSQHDVTKLDRSKESDVIKVLTDNINNKETELNSNPLPSRNKSQSPTHKKEEVNFEHLEKAAESLVDTWTAEEDEKVDGSHISNSSLSQWFYRDPQGIIQGPFSDSEMAEWFRTGYFNMSLLVRRGLDGHFCPLGEMVKQWGCVPFLSSSVPAVVQPAPPTPVQPPQVPQPIPSVQASVLNDLLGPVGLPMEHQNDLTSDHDQQLRLLQQQLLQQQLLQQQQLFQQQQQQQMYIRQQLQQVLGGMKPADTFPPLSSQQQQQQFFLLQRVLAQQQQHPPGVVPRPATENNSMSDPVRQFLAQLTATQSTPSKDDSQSLWNMQTRPPRAEMGVRWTGMHNQQASVWDLDTSTASSRETSLGPSHMLPEVLEQEKKLLEEQQKKRLNEEEMMRKQEEEHIRRQLEEDERIREEIRRREEEERLRIEELLRQQREIEERKQKEAEERMLKEQELRRLQEEEKRRQEEREKEERLQQELFQRQEEERLRQQQEFLQQEEQRKREEYRKQEEEKQRLEEEKLKLENQRELQRQLKLQQQEALKRLQKQQKSKPQAPAWGGQTAKPSDSSLTLAEIQKLQEEKERQEKIEWEMQKHLIQQQIQQQQAAQQAKAVSLTWANRANSTSGPVKSLLEIQQEEADKLAQEQEKEQKVKKQQQQANNVSLATAGVWSNTNNHLLRANSSPSPWSFENSGSNSHSSGFWDDSVPISNGSKIQAQPPSKVPDQRYAALANNTMANGTGQAGKSRMIKARKEEETVMKLFEGQTQNLDEFTKWCDQTLLSISMQSPVDVPTFVSFLKDVESPYDVYDYVKAYLGETKEAQNFAKQFLEKRSKYRNKDHKKEENMWGPAPAITPSLSKLQPSELEGPKIAGAKRKKKRMQKIDNTILGFTVHASMDRVNVGDIDHVEDI